MPLFPPETEIARAVMGPGKAAEWKALAVVLERQGLPRVDPAFGARYWPAVKAWLDRRAGIGSMTVPATPDGKENWHEPDRGRSRARP